LIAAIEGLWERLRSLSGSGRSPAGNRILVHFNTLVRVNT